MKDIIDDLNFGYDLLKKAVTDLLPAGDHHVVVVNDQKDEGVVRSSNGLSAVATTAGTTAHRWDVPTT